MAVERTPEVKRQRTQGKIDNSPTPPSTQPLLSTSPIVPPNANVVQSPTQPTTQSTVQPVTPSITQPPQPPAQAPIPTHRQIMQQLQFVVAKRKQLDEDHKTWAMRKQVAITQGNAEVLNLCDKEILKCKEQFVRCNQALSVLQQQARRLQQSAPQNSNSQGQDPPHPNINATQGVRATAFPPQEPQTPLNPNLTTTPRQSSTVQSPNQNPQTIPAGASGTVSPTQNPGAASPTNTLMTQLMSGTVPKTPSSSVLNAQMQKLNELRDPPRGGGMTSGQGLPGMLPTEGGTNSNNGPVIPPLQQPTQNPQLLAQIQSVLVWEGILSFNGIGSDGNRKEVRTGVSASSSNASNRYASQKK